LLIILDLLLGDLDEEGLHLLAFLVLLLLQLLLLGDQRFLLVLQAVKLSSELLLFLLLLKKKLGGVLFLLPQELLLQFLVLVVRLDQRLEVFIDLLLILQRLLFEVRERLLQLDELLEGADELGLRLNVLALLESLYHTHLQLYAFKDIFCALLLDSELVYIAELSTSPFNRLLQVGDFGHQSGWLYIIIGRWHLRGCDGSFSLLLFGLRESILNLRCWHLRKSVADSLIDGAELKAQIGIAMIAAEAHKRLL
jgi:hypothetical protein